MINSNSTHIKHYRWHLNPVLNEKPHHLEIISAFLYQWDINQSTITLIKISTQIQPRSNISAIIWNWLDHFSETIRNQSYMKGNITWNTEWTLADTISTNLCLTYVVQNTITHRQSPPSDSTKIKYSAVISNYQEQTLQPLYEICLQWKNKPHGILN